MVDSLYHARFEVTYSVDGVAVRAKQCFTVTSELDFRDLSGLLSRRIARDLCVSPDLVRLHFVRLVNLYVR